MGGGLGGSSGGAMVAHRYRYGAAGMDHGVLRGVATGNEAPIVDRNRQRGISDIDVGEEKKKREKRGERKRKEGEGRRSTRIRIALPCLVRCSIQLVRCSIQ